MPQSSMTKESPLNKTGKGAIPDVKHFFDPDSAKKAKRIVKKALSSKLVKNSRTKKARRSGTSNLVGRAMKAPVALQIGTCAVLAAGGYALWKNRGKIQKMLGGEAFDAEAKEF